ncbi:flagellin lysine-N-methylase [Paenibacillus sp. S150]|uniref:flagellin lysine-N-methylase n=1 Tax=Paenibacillus sp. S150 TaxID=2749826 RepID=UPI001C59F235|nr:flagellin lysine-N-methylase [Paenibacillus sp. S150]MBW4084537.1 flagellin lysine-N-methylase [Paenibacillus sp. S150]
MQYMQKEYLTPKYMREFQCTGADCEDTCCSWWEITIDQSTYDKYKRIPDKTLREEINKNLVRNPKHSQSYASFKMNQQTGSCSMLKGGLCSIQAKAGETYLSQTCSTYPRLLNDGDEIEVSALLSCPEIARLVLLSEDAMSFTRIPELPTPNLRINKPGSSGSKKKQCILGLRELTLEILRDRQFPLQHRLIMVGVLFDNTAEPLRSGAYAHVMSFMEEFRGELTTNGELRNYDSFASDDQLQFQVLNNTLMAHLSEFLWNARYNECMNEYLQGIQRNGSSLSESLHTYRSVREEIYEPYIRGKDYLFENYIINHVYQNFVTDILAGAGLFDFFVKLAADYAFIRLHLAGMAAHRQELNDGMVVKLIQSYTKNYKFSNKFLNAILTDIQEQGYYSLGGMSLLIK